MGDSCEITILRDKVVSTRTVVLRSPKYLVPECVYDVQPRCGADFGCMVYDSGAKFFRIEAF